MCTAVNTSPCKDVQPSSAEPAAQPSSSRAHKAGAPTDPQAAERRPDTPDAGVKAQTLPRARRRQDAAARSATQNTKRMCFRRPAGAGARGRVQEVQWDRRRRVRGATVALPRHAPSSGCSWPRSRPLRACALPSPRCNWRLRAAGGERPATAVAHRQRATDSLRNRRLRRTGRGGRLATQMSERRCFPTSRRPAEREAGRRPTARNPRGKVTAQMS